MYRFMLLIISLFITIQSFALSNPNNIDFKQLKSIKLGASSAEATYIFNSSNGSYAVKNKVVPYSRLSKIMRLRAIARFSGVGNIAVTAVLGDYLDQLAIENGYQYDSETGTFGKSIPNLYRVRFGSLTKHFGSVDNFISDYSSSNSVDAFITPEKRTKLEVAVSTIDYSRLKISPATPVVVAHPFYFDYKGANYSPSFPFPTAAVSSILVQQVAEKVDGANYNPDGTSTSPTRPVTDTELIDHLANAPPAVVADLMVSPDPDGEGHDVMAEAYEQAKPYDPVNDVYLDPSDETTNPNPDDNATPSPVLSFPDFCTWASDVCDFLDMFKGEVPDELPPKEVPYGTLSAIGLDEVDRFESRISFGGQCPSSSFDMNIMGYQISKPIPYHHLCDFLMMIAPWLLAMTYLGTGYFIVENV